MYFGAHFDQRRRREVAANHTRFELGIGGVFQVGAYFPILCSVFTARVFAQGKKGFFAGVSKRRTQDGSQQVRDLDTHGKKRHTSR